MYSKLMKSVWSKLFSNSPQNIEILLYLKNCMCHMKPVIKDMGDSKVCACVCVCVYVRDRERERERERERDQKLSTSNDVTFSIQTVNTMANIFGPQDE